MRNLTTMPASKRDRAVQATLLRRQAEERVGNEPDDLSHRSPHEIKALIHDLHVHQIELELQNDQLRATQAELEIARENLADLYDFAPVGYLTVTRAGEITQANMTSVGMLGVDRLALVGQKFTRFILSSDQEIYYRCVREVLESEEKKACELRVQPAGGSVFFARMEAVRAMEEGQPVCRMVLSDITKQKRAEDRSRESERRQAQYESEEWKRLALEASGLGAWDHDLKKGVISCTGAACEMFGFQSNQWPSWEDLVARIHDDDRPGFLAEIEASSLPTGTRRVDSIFRIVVPGGELRWVRLVAQTSFGIKNGRLAAARRTGVLADVTKLKQAEETLRNHAQELDHLVNDRTARLQQAMTELEHLSYTLVHDLRAPLRAISGYGSLLLDQCKGLDPKHRTFLERSNAAAARMDSLIVEALNYTRVSRERSTLQPMDALALLRQLIETYPQFQEARKSIAIEEPWPMVMGNSALLTQCFSNYLSNALKFVEPGKKPHVRIYVEDEGMRARIWFEDKGIGIDRDGQKRLFRMFQRLQPKYEGTGIGLALVKKAVERMNGDVGVESEPGRGSRFWIELEKAG